MGVVHYLEAPADLLRRDTYRSDIDAFILRAAQMASTHRRAMGYGVLEIRTVSPDPQRPVIGSLTSHRFSGSMELQGHDLRAQVFTERDAEGTYRQRDLCDATQAYERTLFPLTDRIPRLFPPRERVVVPVGPAAMELLQQLNARTSHTLKALEEVLAADHAFTGAVLRPAP